MKGSKIKEHLKELASKESSTITKICRDVVRIPTENPPAVTRELCGYVRDYLSDSGVPSEVHDFGDGRQVLYSKFEFTKDERGLIFYTHGDVVPAGPREKWSLDPYAGEVRDGVLFGRGACDMKAGLAAELWAYVNLINNAEGELKGSLSFCITADEENWFKTDMGWGTAAWLLDSGKVKGTGCVMGEPTGIRNVAIGEKGDYWIKLVARGEPAHGSTPPMGENAIDNLIRAIEAIHRLWNLRIKQPAVVRSVLPASREFLREYFRMAGKGRVVKEGLKLLDRISVNVGKISGGTMINIVADSAETEIALCIPHGINKHKASRLVMRTLKEAKVKGVEVFEMDEAIADPTITPPTNELVEIVASNVEEIMKVKARKYLQPSTSDANVFRARGIPTCWMGPGELVYAHTYKEHVRLEDVVTAAKIYTGIGVDYLTR